MSDASPIVLMLGRDDWQKDGLLNRMLRDCLQRQGCRLVHEDPATGWLDRVAWFTALWPGRSVRVRRAGTRLGQLMYAALHPGYLRFLFMRHRGEIGARSHRLRAIVARLRTRGAPRLIVIGRSSGGRIATQVADELALSCVICLGYPYKHPSHPDEPERYRHLATLRTPTLVIQGRDDVYGGLAVGATYPHSPAVRLVFADTDHDFILSAAERERVLREIEAALLAA